MRIGGFQKFSLLDYPGLVSAIVFTQGCNFRCPYCHNPELVLPDQFGETVDPEWILAFLETRQGRLDGVTITGGEPTIQPDVLEWLEAIKQRSFRVKLDTNGSNPHVVKQALDRNLLDFIAMDIKAPLDSYAALAGTAVDTAAIEQSIAHILHSGIAYQFRTTLAPTLLTEAMKTDIRRWMDCLRAAHVFQECVLSNTHTVMMQTSSHQETIQSDVSQRRSSNAA
jgi:pyruvate formate lyase activating enzyme